MKLLWSRILLFSILTFGATLAYAQTTATVTGVVTDSLGAVMPGVSVVLSNPTTGVSLHGEDGFRWVLSRAKRASGSGL